MQIPYHIKVDLQEYYEKFYEWPVPDFSDKCPLCGGIKCACYLGCYFRTATCPLTGIFIPDLPVLRFLCSRKGDHIVCDHVTFSLLPLMLVPYRRLSLKFMVLATWIRYPYGVDLKRKNHRLLLWLKINVPFPKGVALGKSKLKYFITGTRMK